MRITWCPILCRCQKNDSVFARHRRQVAYGWYDHACARGTVAVLVQLFGTGVLCVGAVLVVDIMEQHFVQASPIKDFPDLKGKNVVVTAGTTSERLIREMNEKNSMGMNIISAKDHGESFLTLQSGRAVAFMLDDALLAGERAKARTCFEAFLAKASPAQYGEVIPKVRDALAELR